MDSETRFPLFGLARFRSASVISLHADQGPSFINKLPVLWAVAAGEKLMLMGRSDLLHKPVVTAPLPLARETSADK